MRTKINLLDIVESEEPDVVEELEKERWTKCVMELIPGILSKREQFILTKRYGLYGETPMTQREIAIHLNISRSYVSRIEKKAILKLAECLKEE